MLISLAELVASRLPAVRLRHFARIALVEAHAGQHDPAGRLDPRGEAHAVGIRLHLRAGDHQQRHGRAPAVQQAGELRISSRLSCGAENTTTSTLSIAAA